MVLQHSEQSPHCLPGAAIADGYFTTTPPTVADPVPLHPAAP